MEGAAGPKVQFTKRPLEGKKTPETEALDKMMIASGYIKNSFEEMRVTPENIGAEREKISH